MVCYDGRLSAFCRTKPYTGTLVQGKQGTLHYKIKQMEQRPSSEWIRVPDAHEALIPKQDFELVQRIRRLDTRTSPKKDTVYLFSGILICGCCGARMTRKTNRVKGKEYHYYYCPHREKAWLCQSCDAQGERSGGVCQRQPEGVHRQCDLPASHSGRHRPEQHQPGAGE